MFFGINVNLVLRRLFWKFMEQDLNPSRDQVDHRDEDDLF